MDEKSNKIPLFGWLLIVLILLVNISFANKMAFEALIGQFGLNAVKRFYTAFKVIISQNHLIVTLFYLIGTLMTTYVANVGGVKNTSESFKNKVVGIGIFTMLLSCLTSLFLDFTIAFLVYVPSIIASTICIVLFRRYLKSIGYSIWGFGGSNITTYAKFNPFKKDTNIFNRLIDGVETNEIYTKEGFSIEASEPSGWINFPQIYRHFFLLGGPGAGKTASVLKLFLRNAIVNLQQSVFCYDYKSPELTNYVYNLWIEAKQKYGEAYKVKFFTLNFTDVLKSHRHNPLDPAYITKTADATQMTEVLYKNLVQTGGQKSGGNPYFDNSAKAYITSAIWFLRKMGFIYNHNYSNLASLLYLINSSHSDKAIYALAYDTELTAYMAGFLEHIEKANFETLASQISSAQMALIKLNDKPLLYLTYENDFGVDMNNPNEPKIICISNQGDYDEVYGPIVGLFSTNLFRICNLPNKLPSAVVFDEIPTVYLPTIDKLLNTGRSNKISVMLAAQAFSQFKEKYGAEKAENVRAGCLNALYGNIKEKESPEYVSKMMGKGEITKRSSSVSENTSQSYQGQFEDIIQPSEVMTLPQGAFAGISSGGYRDKQQNDRKFIAWFKFKPYEEKHQIPYITQIDGRTPTKEEMDLYLSEFVQNVKEHVDELILVEFWTKFILNFIHRFRKDKFPPVSEVNEENIRAFCHRTYRDLEAELNKLIASQVQKTHPFKLADKLIQQIYNASEANKKDDDNYMVE